jgi:hypothetical protein
VGAHGDGQVADAQAGWNHNLVGIVDAIQLAGLDADERLMVIRSTTD